jgi:hypothetical protein
MAADPGIRNFYIIHNSRVTLCINKTNAMQIPSVEKACVIEYFVPYRSDRRYRFIHGGYRFLSVVMTYSYFATNILNSGG